MAFRERLFVERLVGDTKQTLQRIFSKRRKTFWGETPILFRVRKYKHAGEIRDEWVQRLLQC